MSTKKVNCMKNNCSKYNLKTMSEIHIIPFEDGTAETNKLFSYFLHNAPNIESAHSKLLESDLHESIFSMMFESRHYVYKKFCWANAVIEDELDKGFLNSDALCLKCKRFVCKKKKTEKNKPRETDLDCFLRHIRNTIAHGGVYYCHSGNKIHIVFEDQNPSGKISARIVCIKADLEYWKSILSDKRYYNEN